MSKLAVKIQMDFEQFLAEMVRRFEPYPDLHEKVQSLSVLKNSIRRPFTLAVFGKMKTGKSSLINALLKEPLTITGVDEATATINRISYGDEQKAQNFEVHWDNGGIDVKSRSELKEWTGKSSEVLQRIERTSYLKMFAEVDELKNVQIVDTPGTGSVVSAHEDVAKNFLRVDKDTVDEGGKADALLYVFDVVALEMNKEALEEFDESRMPGSEPYNSMGVLHRWETLDDDEFTSDADLLDAAYNKAKRIMKQLGEKVSNVIPVSAPLAMVSYHAPDAFFIDLLKLTRGSCDVDSLTKFLLKSSGDKLWDRDEERAKVRKMYSEHLPWICFKRVVKLLLEHKVSNPKEAREVCLKASNIKQLKSELDERFYRRAAIIKQRLVKVKATPLIDEAFEYFNDRMEQLSEDRINFLNLKDLGDHKKSIEVWLSRKIDSCLVECSQFTKWTEDASEEWEEEKERMDLLDQDFIFIEAMDKDPSVVDADHAPIIRSLFNEGLEEDAQIPISSQVIREMRKKYTPKTNSPSQMKKANYEHLVNRLSERLSHLESM